MTQTTDPTAVHASIEVNASAARAFEVFTRDFGAFKPPEHNLLAVPIAETVVETRVGGHIIDRGADGSECPWATVLAYEPPDRFVFSWNISPYWQIETDAEQAQRGRGHLHRPGRGPHSRRHQASPPRPARRGLGRRSRWRQHGRGLAAVPDRYADLLAAYSQVDA